MLSNDAYCEERTEERFHTYCEFVRWRKNGRKQIGAGELIDVSKHGLSLRMDANDRSALGKGDEISVRPVGPGLQPRRYQVMWVRSVNGKRMMGCVRVRPPSCAVELSRNPRNPCRAELHRPKNVSFQPSTSSFVLARHRPELDCQVDQRKVAA